MNHQDEMVTDVVQTVPDANNTFVFLESTANGLGDYFHEMWRAAMCSESDYLSVLFPWFQRSDTFAVIPQRWVVERSFGWLENVEDFGKTVNAKSILAYLFF